MRLLRPRYVVLFISILLVVGGIATASAVQSNFGTVQVQEVDLFTAESVLIHSTLQVPLAASSTNQMPGVVVIHGVIQSKEWLMAFGIELARRGFVVLTIDATGHGDSGPSIVAGGDRGGIAALAFLEGLPYVSTIGMVGHSMGAGIAIQAVNRSSVAVDALVLVGGGTGGTWANASYPKNLLIATGWFDELASIPAMANSVAATFNTTAPVTIGQLYGSFTNGTARRFIAPPTNHLFETIDPTIVSETVDWLRNSLKGPTPDPYWLPKENLIYLAHIGGGLVACMGIILSLFPLMAILVTVKPFSQLKQPRSSEYAARLRTYLGLGALYGVIGVGAFLPFILLGYFVRFPQSFGLPIGFWLLGSGLIAAAVLLIVVKWMRQSTKVTWSDFGAFGADARTFLKQFGLATLLGLLCLLWLYLWMLPVDLLFALDFRAFLPLLNDLTPIRALLAPVYLLFTIPFFFVDGLWLMGLLRTARRGTWATTQLAWTTEAIFIKCIPYLLVLFVQFAASYAIGRPFLSGQLGFMLVFLWMIIPTMAIATSLAAWSYRLTDHIYVSVILNALLFSWIMASILPIAL
jgi:dienelactone hydrolase